MSELITLLVSPMSTELEREAAAEIVRLREQLRAQRTGPTTEYRSFVTSPSKLGEDLTRELSEGRGWSLAEVVAVPGRRVDLPGTDLVVLLERHTDAFLSACERATVALQAHRLLEEQMNSLLSRGMPETLRDSLERALAESRRLLTTP